MTTNKKTADQGGKVHAPENPELTPAEIEQIEALEHPGKTTPDEMIMPVERAAAMEAARVDPSPAGIASDSAHHKEHFEPGSAPPDGRSAPINPVPAWGPASWFRIGLSVLAVLIGIALLASLIW